MLKPGFLLLLFSLFFATSQAQTIKHERVRISYQAALGRLPDENSELHYWVTTQDPKDRDLNLSQLIERHRNFMYSLSPGAGRAAIRQAVRDVYGREPFDPEMNKYVPKRMTYAEVVTDLLFSLKERERIGMPEYEVVIKTAYTAWNRSNIRRSQLNELRKQPMKRYLDWYFYFKVQSTGKSIDVASRSVMGTRTLQYAKENLIKLPQALYSEAELAAGIKNITLQGNNIIGQDTGSFVSTNSGTVISTGGGNVISTGGGNVIATGGGNLIGQAGGN